MTCENGKCQTGWVIGTFVMYLLMGVGWIVGGRQMPELAMGGMILGVATLVLGALNLLALKKYCNVESAAWLHVVTGLVTMVMAFGVLMPQIQDRFSVKTIAGACCMWTDSCARALCFTQTFRALRRMSTVKNPWMR